MSADGRERSRAELLAELAAVAAKLAEKERGEKALRAELRAMHENVQTATRLLRRTVEASNRSIRELRAAKRRAEAATRAKGLFLANMSHEIRTPMTAILGFTDLLLEEGDLHNAPPRRIEQLKTLKRTGQHLMNILTDILDLSKIEVGKVELDVQPTSPIELIEDVESVLRTAAEEKGIGLSVHYGSAIPRRMQTDPTRLRQILMNLVGNAIKFTHRGGVRVATHVARAGDGSGKLCVAVSDTGPGLPPEARERIFDAFSQADNSTTRQFGGTGLGLTISRELARLLGGEVAVESMEGHGSVFTLTLGLGPLEGVEMVERPEEEAEAAEAEREEESTRDFLERIKRRQLGARVLVVEDGEDNRRLISLTLGKAGFHADHAENGQVGLDKALASRETGEAYDLILMDMQMPVMDGYEATRRLRDAGWSRPIIALTAHAMKGDRERCLEAGCDAFATKPIHRRGLIELLLAQLDKLRDGAGGG